MHVIIMTITIIVVIILVMYGGVKLWQSWWWWWSWLSWWSWWSYYWICMLEYARDRQWQQRPPTGETPTLNTHNLVSPFFVNTHNLIIPHILFYLFFLYLIASSYYRWILSHLEYWLLPHKLFLIFTILFISIFFQLLNPAHPCFRKDVHTCHLTANNAKRMIKTVLKKVCLFSVCVWRRMKAETEHSRLKKGSGLRLGGETHC